MLIWLLLFNHSTTSEQSFSSPSQFCLKPVEYFWSLLFSDFSAFPCVLVYLTAMLHSCTYVKHKHSFPLRHQNFTQSDQFQLHLQGANGE